MIVLAPTVIDASGFESGAEGNELWREKFSHMVFNMQERVLLFSRYPEPGRTKKRLIDSLGAQGAAELQRRMTELAVEKGTQLARERRVSLSVYFEGGDSGLMEKWLGPGTYRPQGPGDLGERMRCAFDRAFEEGAQRVIIVGTDCPSLSLEIMTQALDRLQDHELVIGPARDGGYYLIGLQKPLPQLFSNVPWGTDRVLAKTLSRANRLDLSFILLEELSDVDRPSDLDVLFCEMP
ncbi:MAG: TIGR04282 family arsenosugar biosynthesis glycosyltransferase [Desulfobulbaceae bacterium]|nr:TIGR04282 family arsenosugar biosynthesis glycosyltransferase [Desulfobulbaceae bacterium]